MTLRAYTAAFACFEARRCKDNWATDLGSGGKGQAFTAETLLAISLKLSKNKFFAVFFSDLSDKAMETRAVPDGKV